MEAIIGQRRCGNVRIPCIGLLRTGDNQNFKESLKEGMTVVDIGTNIGYYTIIAGKKVGQKGKVFGYEPNLGSFNLLQQNIQINNFNNITTVNIALSDKPGKRILSFWRQQMHPFFRRQQKNRQK